MILLTWNNFTYFFKDLLTLFIDGPLYILCSILINFSPDQFTAESSFASPFSMAGSDVHSSLILTQKRFGMPKVATIKNKFTEMHKVRLGFQLLVWKFDRKKNPIRDHPFKTSACLRGGGVKNLPNLPTDSTKKLPTLGG